MLGSFQIEFLGVDHPDYFPGYGLGPSSDYSDCTFGVGDTEAEALDDCIGMLAQRVDLSDDDVKRIRAEYGDVDEETTAADAVGCEDSDDCYGPLYHVGIKWNLRRDERKQRIQNIPNLEPLRYESYQGYGRGYTDRADGSASYGDFRRTDWNDKGELYFYVPYASGSDYSGSTVEKANAKWFEDTFGDNEWVHPVYGGHGTYAVAVGLSGLLACDDDTFEEVCEALEGLDGYPVFDDDALSELECEGTEEAWNNWVSGDFTRAVEKKFEDCADFEWPDDDDVRTFFEECADRANEYWYNEGYGNDMYINVDRIVDGIDFDDVEKWAVKFEVSYIDVGEEKEVFYVESEAAARAAELRESGLFASYK